MMNTLGKNWTQDAGWPAGAGTADAPGPPESCQPPLSGPAVGAREQTLALHMGLPGTRLDILLGGPHPMLAELARHLARTAAHADHAGISAISSNNDTTQENL